MKKRIFSALITIVMVVSLLPTAIFAADPPSGYTTNEQGIMAYAKKWDHNFDIRSNYNGSWILTTYASTGYEVEHQGLDSATISAEASFVNDGRYIQLKYTVTAGSNPVIDGKLAVHADVKIGNNDNATVEVIKDAKDNEIGLRMVDTNPSSSTKDAQFNLYFDRTGGVTPISTYWIGHYSERDDNAFNGLTSTTASESGVYNEDYTGYSNGDSGFAISWQGINLEAGASKSFSFIVGIGEKADPPEWGEANSVNLALDATAGIIDVSAFVKDANGLTDILYYSADGAEGIRLGSVEADGNEKSITGEIDLTNYQPGTYCFSFWVVNSKGAASHSVVRKITIEEDGAIEVLVTYTIDIKQGTGHSQMITGGDMGALEGSTHEVSASPAPGYTFVNWTENGEEVSTSASYTFTVTCDRILTANFEAIPYNVTVTEPTNGTVSVDKTSAIINDTITITVEPDDNYLVDSVFYTPEGESKTTVTANNGTYSFTMPAKNVDVSATFKENVPHSIALWDANGTTEGGSYRVDKASAKAGETVTITVTPDTGYVAVVFADGMPGGYSLRVTRVDDNTYTFEMPSDPVCVDVDFYMPSLSVICGEDIFYADDLEEAFYVAYNLSYEYNGAPVTIKVLQDYVENGSASSFDNYVPVTLDLNGHHIYFKNTFWGVQPMSFDAQNYQDKVGSIWIYQDDSAELTLIDSSAAKTGFVHGMLEVMYGSLRISGGTYYGVVFPADTKISGGTFLGMPQAIIDNDSTGLYETWIGSISVFPASVYYPSYEDEDSARAAMEGIVADEYMATKEIVASESPNGFWLAGFPANTSVVKITYTGSVSTETGAMDNVSADGLDEVAQEVNSDIVLTVEVEGADVTNDEQTAIVNKADGRTLDFLDITLKKVGGAAITDQLPTVLEIEIPFTVSNKKNFSVYRYHGSDVDTFSALDEKPNVDGRADKTFYVDSENDTIYIYTNQFSTYAIGYDVLDQWDDSFYDSWMMALMMLFNQKFDITASASEGGSITPLGTSTVKYSKHVTYTITPADGYEIAAVLVDGKDVGAISEYTFTNVRKNHTIKAVFEKIKWQNPFSDVNATDWFYEDIAYANENGLMKGMEDTLFSPASALNRAMLVTILWRLEGEPVVNYIMPFADVPGGEWYTEAIRWAAAEGIINGYEDGTFRPENEITREQAMAIFHRYASYKNITNVTNVELLLSYKYSQWAENDIIWANTIGLMDGIGKDFLDMTAIADRAEIAAYLRRFCESTGK